MADQSAREPAAEPSATDGDPRPKKGAPTLRTPADPALAGAIDTFVRGDFRAAAAEMPASVDDDADDRAWRDRLDRALGWEPSLWIALAVCSAAWLWVYLSTHAS